MDPSKNVVEDGLLEESDISSLSTFGEIDTKDEEIRKLKAELQQIKEANSNQFGGQMMQIGEKFGELKEIDGLKSANQEGIQAFEESKAEMTKMKDAFNRLKEEFEKTAGENAGLKEKMDKMKQVAGKTAKMDEMEKKKNTELGGQIVEKNHEMGKMKEEKDEEKAKLEGLKAEVDKMKEEFSVKNSEMRESLEQKADKEMVANLTGRIEGMEFIQMKNNMVVEYSSHRKSNCVRAISPIPTFNLDATKPSIAGYFETQIVHKEGNVSIDIGFCTKEFPLEGKWLGNETNSIGIFRKAGMDIDGRFNKFGNNADGYFNVGDVIGVGIIHFPANKSMKCFATMNGQLLGTIKLPDNFSSLELFPAATLCFPGESIRANFGQETFRFDASQLLK